MTKPHIHRPRSQKMKMKERLRLAQARSEVYRLPNMVVTLPKLPWETDDEHRTTHDGNVTNKSSD